ncbi:MAG: 16S rRNA (cytidine(1402)-2'-O)-methyltransferase [Chloroflexia bacterium]|nr:16S rRNA (cytidine(1402)-2'-O)-methyltransferase [Chloroflexia bacterium]
MGGTLYLVSTPIGNLEDISLRALRVLRQVELVVAEDTRHTGRLLSHYDIHTPLRSYHDHSGAARREEIIEFLQQHDVALVSDAGTPGLADPGYRLVSQALERGLALEAVPGPSAAIAALVLSGLPTDRFIFLGYLPRQQGKRRRLLQSVAGLTYTLICFETPHRLQQSLADLQEVLGDRRSAIARELTKLHQEVRRERLSQARAHFEQQDPRGEFTLVIAGAAEGPASEAMVRSRLRELHEEGCRASEAARIVAGETGWPRRQVYELWLETEQGTE